MCFSNETKSIEYKIYLIQNDNVMIPTSTLRSTVREEESIFICSWNILKRNWLFPGLIHIYSYTLKLNKYLFCFISLFHLFIYLFVCLFVCLFIYLFIYLFVCLFIYLFIYLMLISILNNCVLWINFLVSYQIIKAY